MSRIDDTRRQDAAREAERAQKENATKSRDAKADQAKRNAFQGALKRGNAQRQSAADRAAGRHAQNAQEQGRGQAAQQKNAATARHARMARGGMMQHQRFMAQAKSFQGTLAKQATESQGETHGQLKTGDKAVREERVETNERLTETDAKQELQREEQAAVQNEENQANGTVTAGAVQRRQDGGGDSGGQDGGEEARQQMALKAKQTPQMAAAQKSSKAAAPTPIPPEILDKLVNGIMIGFNAKGLEEFQLELKEGVLAGATVKISTENGGVNLAFVGTEGNGRRLLQACEGEIGKRLQKAGMRLNTFSVA